MGTITFQGRSPFELEIQNMPTASAQDENVVLTLPVFAADPHRQAAEIRVILSLSQAQQIAAQLDPAMRLVQAHLRNRR